MYTVQYRRYYSIRLMLNPHCCKNNQILRIKTEPVTAGGLANIWHLYISRHTVCRCISSNRDRLGFYAENLILFGTVRWVRKETGVQMYTSAVLLPCQTGYKGTDSIRYCCIRDAKGIQPLKIESFGKLYNFFEAV